MTAEGRLARGKANCEARKFLDNSETKEYIATLPEVKEAKPKAKEVKKDASHRR